MHPRFEVVRPNTAIGTHGHGQQVIDWLDGKGFA